MLVLFEVWIHQGEHLLVVIRSESHLGIHHVVLEVLLSSARVVGGERP